jgi:hypothetical protein
MRKRIVTTVALAAVLASAPGCFTVIGTGIGAISEGPPKREPRLVREVKGPPGGQAPPFYSFDTKSGGDDTGMSSTTKGFLIGGAIDLTLLGLMVVALSSWDGYDE